MRQARQLPDHCVRREARGQAPKIASLYVGRWEDGELLYAGKARSGYTEEIARDIRERLDPLIITHSALSVPVKKPKATWVKPEVEAEIAYSSVTADGLLREAVFRGIREDLAPAPAPSNGRKAAQRVKQGAGVSLGKRISCSSCRMP